MTDYQMQQLIALAEKLGTTAEHLWAVLILQARIEIFVDMFYLGLLLALFLVVKKLHPFLMKKAEQEDLWVFPMGIAWIALGIFAVIVIIVQSEIPGLIFNPEYWAMKQVLSVLHK